MFHAGLLPRPEPPAPDWPARLRAQAAHLRDPRLRAFCAAGTVPGHTPLREVPLLALDLETTGLDPERDGIVSLGLVPLTLERVQASAARHWLLRPRVPLGDAAVTVHGITHQQIDQAPDLDAVLGEVLQALAGHVVVVHCRAVERGFLDSALRRRLGETLDFPVIDTMALEARWRRTPVPLWRRWLGQAPAPVSLRLAACRERYGLPRYRLHHALTDALATAELLQAQVAHHLLPDTPVRELWL
ncbi:3'-5' exonuclease [Aquabacterium sp. A08]|uniref:3'-5' exonuclease n=1 Tax=Aquabacterium sp. A08 TaxID=2718532 RepID=UPI0014206F76|nr:3'-5' exonuclease [Aquabacterium sp. A08]NIC41312.1 3'-5' exonuclease [Aquabacterium sp. A08]NIC42692.1 3'-5' exonuclease [Aquabacterium sp. A08]